MSEIVSEVSIVMPCLDEADTLAICIDKAQIALKQLGIVGEIIVADNGSKDQSRVIAQAKGARVVEVSQKGYGFALMGGIAAARSPWVIMGDADDSYDFLELGKFVSKLREGFDLVQGCRLPRGGGKIMPRAMPFSHRWIGNPLFSLMGRWWFKAPVNDIYCGMRGFKKKFYEKLDLRCVGMEFATEMIVKSALLKAKIAEVPITLHPDGRKAHRPHLKTVRDGWRTLRFLLIYCPRWLYFLPGLVMIGVSMLGYAIAMPGLTFFGATFDAHTLLFSSLAFLIGYQAILFGMFTRVFAEGERLLPRDPYVRSFLSRVSLEHGLVIGLLGFIAGVLLLAAAVRLWLTNHFGHLDYPHTMRWVIPGFTLSFWGLETVFGSFFISILRMRRR